MKNIHKVIFLDKDGTLIPDIPYNVNPALITLVPGAGQALRQLQDAGYHLIIVSNQSGVALGYFDEADLTPVSLRLWELLAEQDIYPLAIYYCPHAAEGKILPYACPCQCRKPLPGLLLKAADDFGISLPDSWMIGDILNDVEAGRRVACRTILLNNGNETEWKMNEWRKPDFMVNDLREAAATILDKQPAHVTRIRI
jgi:D-glycero-D-manno-heptose 1,7-bisphosphate phosphatase